MGPSSPAATTGWWARGSSRASSRTTVWPVRMTSPDTDRSRGNCVPRRRLPCNPSATTISSHAASSPGAATMVRSPLVSRRRWRQSASSARRWGSTPSCPSASSALETSSTIANMGSRRSTVTDVIAATVRMAVHRAKGTWSHDRRPTARFDGGPCGVAISFGVRPDARRDAVGLPVERGSLLRSGRTAERPGGKGGHVHDLVIRGGVVVDGTGAPARRADIAVDGERITAVGAVADGGRTEVDADGLHVLPGFVDIHTHYDGQATWDPELAPSSVHGVTTVLMGNCGVGFAPAAPDRHDWLIGLLEGVEDIPGTALHEGLRWDWESFPSYLDALDRRERTLDVGALIAHNPLRTYVIGTRGADPQESPTESELAAMHRLVAEGLARRHGVLHQPDDLPPHQGREPARHQGGRRARAGGAGGGPPRGGHGHGAADLRPVPAPRPGGDGRRAAPGDGRGPGRRATAVDDGAAAALAPGPLAGGPGPLPRGPGRGGGPEGPGLVPADRRAARPREHAQPVHALPLVPRGGEPAPPRTAGGPAGPRPARRASWPSTTR